MSLFLQPFRRNVKGKYFADKEFHIVLARRNSTQSKVNESEGPGVLDIHCCSLSNISKYLLRAHLCYPFLQHLVFIRKDGMEGGGEISYALIAQLPHTA